MEEGKPSFTAIVTAMRRAYHLLWDDYPKILDDTFALRFSGCTDEADVRHQLEALLAKAAAYAGRDSAEAAFSFARSLVVVRNRYVEDELAQAIQRGTTQYVLLGAGLDSFAYRRPDLANLLRVFEVDHPATQAWKRTRLQESNVPTPSNLVFVPLDFEKGSLIDGLRNSGYRTDMAGLFSWLGVIAYLRRDAIFDTLQTVASMAPGSEIIFDYLLPPELLQGADREMLEHGMKVLAAQGEPWVSLFEPAALAREVGRLGFAEVWDLRPDDANARYFANRADGLGLRPMAHLLGARV